MNRSTRRDLYRLSKRLLIRLARRRWSGNVRQLERAARDFLRGAGRAYLVRLLQRRAVAIGAASMVLATAAHGAPPVELRDVVAGEETGFVLDGITFNGRVGVSVGGGGDVNGDGLDDIIVGANNGIPYSPGWYGQSYVVFGKSDNSRVDLNDVIAGTGGFTLNGYSGRAVAIVGDVNGDGKDDIAIGDDGWGLYDDLGKGRTFVVFGKSTTEAVDLAAVAGGTGGFAITGGTEGDASGASVAGAGDINGDGKADIVVGAPRGGGYTALFAGEAYVIFGKSTTTGIDLADVEAGTGGGFAILGQDQRGYVGTSVAAAGDVNGDGTDDVIIGAYYNDPQDSIGGNNGLAEGQAYVIFGKSTATAIKLTDVDAGTGGFAINGRAIQTRTGYSVAGIGDMNGDGKDDVIIGAPRVDSNGSNNGESYVVFGKATTEQVETSDIVLGDGGFVIAGRNRGYFSGYAVSGPGDINGDFIPDVLVSAIWASPTFPPYGYGEARAGEVYVVFGKQDTAPVDITNIVDDYAGGYVIKGINDYDFAGTSLSGAGDVNGDGLNDLILGAPPATGGDGQIQDAGQAYVVFNPLAPSGLRVSLRDSQSGLPITTGQVFAERTDYPIGFNASVNGEDSDGAVYETRLSDVVEYRIRAKASGFLPTEPILVTPDPGAAPVTILDLDADAGLANSNVVRVVVELLDDLEQPTGARILTDSAVLKEDDVDTGLTTIFGRGEMVFLGVPSGTFEVSIPGTAEYLFTSKLVTVGTGEDETVTLGALFLSPDDNSPPARTAAAVPGSIVGTVADTGRVTPAPVAKSLVISTQTDSGISTLAIADNSGQFFMPDIVAGTGVLQAFSEDGNIAGTAKPVTIISGEVFGDDPGEDTSMEVVLNAGAPIVDSDGDGLSDAFEQAFVGVVPENRRGPNDDPDGEGLTNLEEFNAGTDPTNIDSDSDTYPDGVELVLGSDPNNGASTPTPPDPLYVDFGFTDALQAGTLDQPHATLEGAADAAAPGSTVRVKGDVNDVSGDPPASPITKQVTVEAFRGPIEIR